jgi:hypothetical protein
VLELDGEVVLRPLEVLRPAGEACLDAPLRAGQSCGELDAGLPLPLGELSTALVGDAALFPGDLRERVRPRAGEQTFQLLRLPGCLGRRDLPQVPLGPRDLGVDPASAGERALERDAREGGEEANGEPSGREAVHLTGVEREDDPAGRGGRADGRGRDRRRRPPGHAPGDQRQLEGYDEYARREQGLEDALALHASPS